MDGPYIVELQRSLDECKVDLQRLQTSHKEALDTNQDLIKQNSKAIEDLKLHHVSLFINGFIQWMFDKASRLEKSKMKPLLFWAHHILSARLSHIVMDRLLKEGKRGIELWKCYVYLGSMFVF